MKFFNFQSVCICLGTVLSFCLLQAEELNVQTSDGNQITLDIHENDTFFDVMSRLSDLLPSLMDDGCCHLAQGQHFLFSKEHSNQNIRYAVNIFNENDVKIISTSSRHMPIGVRNYHTSLTEAQRTDIRYIVTTLGNVPIPNLLFYKSSLEDAGDRIDSVHPLRFLEYVFTNEELKVGIRNVKAKGNWVYGDFLGGLSNSLNEESDYMNMTDEFITDFANNVQIDLASIYPIIKQRQWGLLIDTLISKIPRKGDTKRYNM